MLETAAAVRWQSKTRVSVKQWETEDLDQSFFTKSLEILPNVFNAPQNQKSIFLAKKIKANIVQMNIVENESDNSSAQAVGVALVLVGLRS